MESNFPLRLAIANGHLNIVKWLLAEGLAYPEKCGYSTWLETAIAGVLSHSEDAIQQWASVRAEMVSLVLRSMPKASEPMEIIRWCWKHPYPSKQSNLEVMKLLVLSGVIIFKEGLYYSNNSFDWFAELVLEGGEIEDEAVRWLCEVYYARVRHPALAKVIAFSIPMKTAKLVKTNKVTIMKRVKSVSAKLRDHHEGNAFMSNEERELCERELELSRKEAVQNYELAKKYSFARAAQLLVTKWGVSVREMLSATFAFGGKLMGKRGDVEWLHLIWSYYQEEDKQKRQQKQEEIDNDQNSDLWLINGIRRLLFYEALEAAVEAGELNFVREISKLTKEEGIQLSIRLQLVAAIASAQLSTVLSLVKTDPKLITQQIFDLILEAGSVDIADWAVSCYLEELGTSLSLMVAEKARNAACSVLGSWLEKHSRKGKETIVTPREEKSEQRDHNNGNDEEATKRRRLCLEVVRRQEIVQALEEHILLRARPPFVDDSGDLDEWLLCGSSNRDWMLYAFQKACEEFYRVVPSDYVRNSASSLVEEEDEHDELDPVDALEERISFR
eukprot:TRINITY_DN345_c1_g5_i1.p1 TRINITY_DN345_c1_g5~~TRINITY_DN345_c1_g5_i1.p1  ORF type:complete len:558 (+),score=134.14 TRINITY_DN345_c1_g5_i1:665-2338(+)